MILRRVIKHVRNQEWAAERTFEQNCLRADFRLDGMKEPTRPATATP